jgi:Fe(3+) dicitrate transport protein
MKKTAILIALLSSNAFADDLAPLSIFGGQATDEIAGSASFIDDAQMKKSGYTDIERLLNEVPGVYSQTEDGLGLRTNIGMRGVSAIRTTKVNITEDGILQGPAVYSNPSMYFFPDVGRAEGIEVLKGAAAIGNGPRTTAGAINILSRSIPTESEGYYGFTMGDDNYYRQHTYYGGAMGNLSYVVELSNAGTDGHKEVEPASGNDTNAGYRKNSDLFKLRYSMPSSYIEFSSQNTSETSHESYVGLTNADFAANPYKRYAGSSQDKMDNDYHRYILTYSMDLTPQTNMTAKVYKSKYSRNWKKVGEIYVMPNGTDSETLSKVSFDDIDWAGNCVAGNADDIRACNIMTNGTAMLYDGTFSTDDEYIKRAIGHRDYGMYGYHIEVDHTMGNHEFTLGYRSHHDYRQRLDNGVSQKYTLGSNNTMLQVESDLDRSVLQERRSAWADSISIQDRITHGNFVTTLGVRYEDVDYDKIDKDDDSTLTKYDNSETMIAASTVYSMGPGQSVFAGFSEGYNPTGPSSIEPDQSDNFEVGYRSRTASSFFEVVAFMVDYDNLNELCSVAAGCGDAPDGNKNAGEAESKGLEVTYKVNNLFGSTQMKGAGEMSGTRYPLTIAMTFQDSERTVTTDSGNTGNTLPYNPEQIFYVSLGAETNDWDYKFAMKYTDEYFTNSANTIKTEDGVVVDFQGGIQLDKLGMRGARAFVNIDNLFDKTYMASAHEYGVRPNKPQTFMAGMTFDF